MATSNSKLTAEIAREFLSYDPITGRLTRKKPHQGVVVGSLCGTAQPDGRLECSVNGGRYKNARLAWLMVTGSWPVHVIDHINGDPSDNRFINLRDVPHRQNMQNQVRAQKANLSSGLLGVTKHRNSWQARLTSGAVKGMYLGSFKTPEAAHQAYLVAKRKHHEGCTI